MPNFSKLCVFAHLYSSKQRLWIFSRSFQDILKGLFHKIEGQYVHLGGQKIISSINQELFGEILSLNIQRVLLCQPFNFLERY